MTTVRGFFKASKLTLPALAIPHSDEGLTLETSALKLLTVADLHYQLS